MLVSRAPMRISLLGGGSDYESHFTRNSGSVLGTTIDSYVYVMALPLPPIASEKFRFTYRVSESVQHVSEINHPVVRATLEKLNWDDPINIATMADLPGNSGLGSSSAFTVALLSLLHTIRGEKLSPNDIASEAVEIERKILLESGGWQDQFFASFGGFCRFEFSKQKVVSRYANNEDSVKMLESHFMLFPIGEARMSSEYASKFAQSITNDKNLVLLNEMSSHSRAAYDCLENESLDAPTKLSLFSCAMTKSWKLKMQTNPSGELSYASEIIDKSLEYGALSGKLCGAGGSGFILLLCPPEKKQTVSEKLNLKHWMSPRIAGNGVEVLNSPVLGNFSHQESRWKINF